MKPAACGPGAQPRSPNGPRSVALSSNTSASSDGMDTAGSTLYIGNLHPLAQQAALEEICAFFGAIESSKFVKDKVTSDCAGYCFVTFAERGAAAAALHALNGANYCGQCLRVNWALPSSRDASAVQHHHLFVGDLAADVTEAMLYNAFCNVGQCADARIMWDHNTGRSKGYGFVSFRCRADADAALVGMQGCMIGSRRVRVGWAQHKEEGVSDAGALDFDSVDRGDPANTNVYVSNVAPETSEADLHLHFSHFGKLEAVRRRFCLFGRRSGLVVFSHFGKLEAVVQ